MSALEPGLLAQLLDAEPAPAEKALRRIVSLFADNAHMSGHELRVLEIAMEGLGAPASERRQAIEAAIQLRRNRVMSRYTEQGRVGHEAA
ncbi:UNVERIFIED_ORG: hypothetical protein JN05_01233 [Zoogloea ramigera]|uniref:Uncharacterized protein n=1 Tax=Duganella zoogloeoides TaxID=75659 RepID=A0ABZ0Y466_9BURK|nr:hypothetical protein [Duganella zoogloeoides]WQH06838.1 hypothetical protein SR858_11070 [Duganella zoogloeoides]